MSEQPQDKGVRLKLVLYNSDDEAIGTWANASDYESERNNTSGDALLAEMSEKQLPVYINWRSDYTPYLRLVTFMIQSRNDYDDWLEQSPEVIEDNRPFYDLTDTNEVAVVVTDKMVSGLAEVELKYTPELQVASIYNFFVQQEETQPDILLKLHMPSHRSTLNVLKSTIYFPYYSDITLEQFATWALENRIDIYDPKHVNFLTSIIKAIDNYEELPKEDLFGIHMDTKEAIFYKTFGQSRDMLVQQESMLISKLVDEIYVRTGLKRKID